MKPVSHQERYVPEGTKRPATTILTRGASICMWCCKKADATTNEISRCCWNDLPMSASYRGAPQWTPEPAVTLVGVQGRGTLVLRTFKESRRMMTRLYPRSSQILYSCRSTSSLWDTPGGESHCPSWLALKSGLTWRNHSDKVPHPGSKELEPSIGVQRSICDLSRSRHWTPLPYSPGSSRADHTKWAIIRIHTTARRAPQL